MTKNADIPRLETGVRNLDAIFHGGLPLGSVSVLGGAPGSGKTILAQQICFHNASPDCRVIFFSTLSEPTAKTLRYLKQFSFFDPRKREDAISFVDLGGMLRTDGLEQISELIMEHLKRIKPSIVVVDSFKVFDDLAKSKEEIRKFGYEIAVNLMAWECTALLLGEYGDKDFDTNPLFSIVDGLFMLSQRETSGEHQRFVKISKMRGTNHSRDEHQFVISKSGIEVFAPRVTIRRDPSAETQPTRCKTGVSKLDDLLGEGIPWGSSLLIAGVAGTGKTVLSLEFIYRGAQLGEKGIYFSFEETEERLRAAALGLGWDLEAEMARGMIEIVFIPQPDIMVESHLLMMRERIEAMGAKRVAVDSVSVFLHKVTDAQVSREKLFHLATIVLNVQAVGFFATDIPYGSTSISRFGVEETVVDGVILLSSTEEGFDRQRYLEVYKLRNTAHHKGRHNMVIERSGVSIFPRYGAAAPNEIPHALEISHRMMSGVDGLDALLDGGLLERSITLIAGSAGAGKSTLAMQFILAGAKQREPGLFVTLEEGPDQIIASADALGMPLRGRIDEGLVEVLYLSREHVRAGQLFAVLADKIKTLGAKRVVLDSATHIVTEHMSEDELRQILYQLVNRFKSLGVTSLVTLETSELYSGSSVTERALSPIADNLFMMRYERVHEQLEPALTIVKTRGSLHDRGTHFISIGKGGLSVGTEPKAKPKKKKS